MAMRALIFEAAVGVIVLILLFWATYYVIKAGVRDGIREAGEGRRAQSKPTAPTGYRWALVKDETTGQDIHAD
ncbi:MAG: hypothetical protein JSS06_00150 [Proteobacteria bacterium]|nr:hypothetical protein [Pseudomonadota bacterium]